MEAGNPLKVAMEKSLKKNIFDYMVQGVKMFLSNRHPSQVLYNIMIINFHVEVHY